MTVLCKMMNLYHEERSGVIEMIENASITITFNCNRVLFEKLGIY